MFQIGGTRLYISFIINVRLYICMVVLVLVECSFIESLITDVNMPFVFYPGTGKFCMAGCDVHFHKVILFKQFEYNFCLPHYLKRLLEGKVYSYPVKGCPDLVFSFTGPIIFISNYEDVTDVALRSRLLFVRASQAYWEGEEVSTVLPAEEVCSSPFVIKLPTMETLTSFSNDEVI